MAAQSLPRAVISLALVAGAAGLLIAGVMFRTADPAAPSGAATPVTIPAVPNTVAPPVLQTDAFTRPLFHRNRAPGSDGIPPVDGDPASSGATGAASASSDFKLQGVIINERGARAALRGATATEPTWVKRGDEIGGWTVDSITAGMVRLRNGDAVAEIRFSKDE